MPDWKSRLGNRLYKTSVDLRLQVLTIFLLLTLPLALIALAFDTLLGQRLRADVQAADLALMQAIAQKTEISLAGELNAVAGLAQYPAVRQGSLPEMEQLFALIAFAHPNVNLIYRLNERGIMQYHYPTGPGSTVGDNFSFRDYFQRAQHSREPLISQGRISPTTGQPVATAVMPLWDENGRFLGLLGANIRLENLSETITVILAEYPAAQGLEVVILDSSNQIVAAPHSELLLTPANDFLPETLLQAFSTQTTSQAFASPHEEEPRLYTQAAVPDLDWRVIGSRPTRIAFASQTFVRQAILLAASVLGLIGLIFWLLLNRRVLLPIEQLAEVSQQIAARQQLTPESRRILLRHANRHDQIGGLMNRVLEMGSAIERRIATQQTLLETSAAVISTLDADTVLQTILEQMGRLLEIQMYAIIQLDPQTHAFRIRASRGLSPHYVKNLAILPDEPDSVTMRALRSGQPVQISDTETDPSYTIRRLRARLEGYRAVLAVPLRTHHAPSTALVVFHPLPHVFDENEIQLLVNFANHAAMAIENATLFERSDARLREQTYRLESLIQSLQEGLILSNLQGEITYINPRMATLTGAHPSTTRQALTMLFQSAEQLPAPLPDLLQKLLGSQPPHSLEFSLREGGQRLTYRLQTFDVLDFQRRRVGLGILLHDITADKELDRMRASLIATVSHELRTPLAAIKGYATTLLADDVEWQPEAQKRFLQIISEETDRLTDMVNDILDLSRLESGALRLQMRPCDFSSLLQETLHRLPIPPEQMQLSLPPALPPLLADPLRVQAILRNLLENAWKYGGEVVQIWIEAQAREKDLLIQIRDNGPGIPPEEQERIFEPFYRAQESAAKTPSGAGLGLAICQGLVQAHGGKLWLEPQPRGASFVFTLPLEPVPHPITL